MRRRKSTTLSLCNERNSFKSGSLKIKEINTKHYFLRICFVPYENLLIESQSFTRIHILGEPETMWIVFLVTLKILSLKTKIKSCFIPCSSVKNQVEKTQKNRSQSLVGTKYP